MTHYALISDVHANLPALDAVLADIAARADIDATYHLGDLVGYAPWPNETVQRILAARIPGIAGNYDSTVGLSYKHCGCKYEDPRQAELAHLSFEWTKQHVSPEVRRVLASLPFRIDLRPLGGHMSGPAVILVHGAPTLNTLYLTEDRPDTFLSRMAEIADAKAGDVLCFGHTHLPWHRTIEGIRFVNTGSVGRPKDGDWRAGYVILGVDESNVSVDFVRVEYDLNAATRAIRESDLPNEFADYLAAGGTLAPTASEQDGEAG
ncbi:MAG TPA: metallophosphoesterase family protein [Gemmatimonadaceae bacterium]